MKSVLKKILAKLGPLIGLLVVIGLFSIKPDVREYFLTYANFKIILTQTVIVALGALGATLIIISGGIDLSPGSGIALTSVVGALLIQHHWPTALVVLGVVAAGGLLGAVNGGATVGMRMTPFIITLGTLGIARGAAKWLADNQTVNYDASPINSWMVTKNPFGWSLPAGVWVTVGFAILTALVLQRTVFGRRVFALGSNEASARLCGVPVNWMKIWIYVIGGAFVGLAGLMQLSRLRQGDPTVAVGLELDIIAAVIIGGASLTGGSGSITGSMIGALIMAVLRNGSQQMGWPTYFQEIIIGLVIIVAVFIDSLRQGKKT